MCMYTGSIVHLIHHTHTWYIVHTLETDTPTYITVKLLLLMYYFCYVEHTKLRIMSFHSMHVRKLNYFVMYFLVKFFHRHAKLRQWKDRSWIYMPPVRNACILHQKQHVLFEGIPVKSAARNRTPPAKSLKPAFFTYTLPPWNKRGTVVLCLEALAEALGQIEPPIYHSVLPKF